METKQQTQDERKRSFWIVKGEEKRIFRSSFRSLLRCFHAHETSRRKEILRISSRKRVKKQNRGVKKMSPEIIVLVFAGLSFVVCGFKEFSSDKFSFSFLLLR